MVVYFITNLVNNKIYVGQTTACLRVRWMDHISAANLWKRTGCKLTTRVDYSIAKYGAENFSVVEIARASSQVELNQLEILFIKKYNSTDPEVGYNLMHGGRSGKHGIESKSRRKKRTHLRICYICFKPFDGNGHKESVSCSRKCHDKMQAITAELGDDVACLYWEKLSREERIIEMRRRRQLWKRNKNKGGFYK